MHTTNENKEDVQQQRNTKIKAYNAVKHIKISRADMYYVWNVLWGF